MNTEGQQSDVGTWLEQCRSDDTEQQVAGIIALQQAESLMAVPIILDLLTSPDDSVRSRAAEALGYIGYDDLGRVGPALIAALSDEEMLVRVEAAESLGALGYAPACDALSNILEEDTDPTVRATVAESLGYLGDDRAIPALLRALRLDPWDMVRRDAAISLGFLGDRDVLPTLQAYRAVEQEDSVKAALASAAYCLGSHEGIDYFVSLLVGADELLAIIMTNILDDLTQRKPPPALEPDATSIRQTLDAVINRYAFLQARGHSIMARLQTLVMESPKTGEP